MQDPISLEILNSPEWMTFVLIALFLCVCLLDSVYRERRFPPDKFWKLRGFIALAYFSAILYFVPFLWDQWFADHALLQLSTWPLYQQFIVGFLIYELGIYAWHRCMHRVPWLWRYGHQLHHTAERVDIYGAFYFHPIDILGFSLLGSLILILGLGVDLTAAVLIGFVANCCALFQHTNIKTPRWFGLFIMRPEAHALHHQRGHHQGNYGDIPLWDALFGTYSNPETWQAEAGFFPGSSLHIKDALLGRDLHASALTSASSETGSDSQEKVMAYRKEL